MPQATQNPNVEQSFGNNEVQLPSLPAAQSSQLPSLPPANRIQDSQSPGFWTSLIQNIANPFARASATLDYGIAAATGNKAKMAALSKGVNAGLYGGTVTPVAINQIKQGNYAGAIADTVGTVANLALYAMGGEELAPAEGAVKGAAETAAKEGVGAAMKAGLQKVAAKSVGAGALRLGALAGISTTGQEYAQGSSPLASLVDGVVSGGLFMAGNAMLSLVGMPLGYFGNRLLQSSAGDYLKSRVGEFGTALLHFFPEGTDNVARLGENATNAARATAFEYDQAKNAIVSQGYRSIVQPVDTDAFAKAVPEQTWRQYDKFAAQKSAQFSAVYNSGAKWVPTTAAEALKGAEAEISGFKQALGGDVDTASTVSYKDAEALFRNQTTATMAEDANKQLSSWVSNIKGLILNPDGTPKTIDIKALDYFIRKFPITGDASEVGFAQKILKAMVSDAKTSLKQSDQGDLADQLDQAFKDASQYAKDRKNGALKVLSDLTNPQEEVTALVNGVRSKLGTPEQVDRVFTYLGGTKGQTEGSWVGKNVAQFRQLVMNIAAQKIKSGASVTPLLNSASETGLLSPIQVQALGEFQMIAKQDFDTWLTQVAPRIGVDADGLRSALGMETAQVEETVAKKTAAESSAAIAKAVRAGEFDLAASKLAATKVASKVTKMTAGLSDADKYGIGYQMTLDAVNGVKMMKKNADGTVDVSGLLKVLNGLKQKATGAQSSLFPDSFREGLENFLNDAEFQKAFANPKSVESGVAGRLAHVGAGFLLIAHHPFIGLGMIREGMSGGLGESAQKEMQLEIQDALVNQGKIPDSILKTLQKLLTKSMPARVVSGKAAQSGAQELDLLPSDQNQ